MSLYPLLNTYISPLQSSFPDASLWLAAYDIANPARLRLVANCCEDYGRRLQQSVFLCDCSSETIQKLRDEVTEEMDPAADHFVLMALCQHCTGHITQHGVQKGLPGSSDPIVM